MLSIYYGKREETILAVEVTFDNNYDDEWFNDPMVKSMIADIDNSTVISPYLIDSPVLGPIPPSDLSGEVKALIMMLKTDWEIWATACGDNCAKWILKIAETKNLTVALTHFMKFPNEEFEFYDVNNGKVRKDYLNFIIDEHVKYAKAKGWI